MIAQDADGGGEQQPPAAQRMPRDAMAEISGQVAEKILRTQIDQATHRRLIEEALVAFESKAGAGV